MDLPLFFLPKTHFHIILLLQINNNCELLNKRNLILSILSVKELMLAKNYIRNDENKLRHLIESCLLTSNNSNVEDTLGSLSVYIIF